MKRRIIVCICALLLCACASTKVEEKPKEEVKENPIHKVSMSITGDLLFEQGLYDSQVNYAFGTYFDEVKPYLQGDIVIGNQEVPIGGHELDVSGVAFSFNAPEEVANQLPNVGFTLMSMSNNHSYDRGYEGVVNTIHNLQYNGIQTIGLYESLEDSQEIKVLNKNGIKIAFLAYTYDTNQYIEKEHEYVVKTFLNDAHVFDEYHKQMIKEDVERAQEIADVVVVSMHWGQEFTYALSPTQLEVSQYLNELGVDLIIGNHSHCLQPMDTLVNKDGKKTVVFYSLGNFVSSAAMVDRASIQFANMYEIGGIVNLDIIYNSDTKEVTIENMTLTPVVNHFEHNYTNFALLPLSKYTNDLAFKHFQHEYSYDFNVEWLNDQVYQLFEGKITLQ